MDWEGRAQLFIFSNFGFSQMHKSGLAVIFLFVLLGAMFVFSGLSSNVMAQSASVYWGALIKGSEYGTINGHTFQDPPWDLQTWDLFESHTGKKISILHMGQAWHRTSQAGYSGILDGFYQKFFPGDFDAIRLRGAIPFFSWGSYEAGNNSSTQPIFKLSNITRGDFDTYLEKWALDAKAWGYPFFLRFNWEMNGDWYNWSELQNGNQAGDYINAWQHVYNIFKSKQANNVTWVWCPNISSNTTIPMNSLYPGDGYVDWICLDGYNKTIGSWIPFTQVFRGGNWNGFHDSYAEITSLTSKPLIIGEFASIESGDNGTMKGSWITDALTTQIPNNFPRIKGIVWFNWNADGTAYKYIIESSSLSQAAFANGISAPVYAANSFAALPTGTKVTPLVPSGSPTPTPTRMPGDTNGDNLVNITDYNKVKSEFGKSICGLVSDFDQNCKVNLFDFNILVKNF